MPPGKTALVLSGGGSRGAAEAGFYRALVELGIPIDFVVGASVGAINGAFIASGLTPAWTRLLWKEFSVRRPFRRTHDGMRNAMLAAALFLSACAPARPDASWDEGRLLESLRGGTDDARRRAARLLAPRRSPAALWPLVRALGDPRWEVRAAAVEALAALRDPRADRALLSAARDRHWWVQTSALKALAGRLPDGSVQAARLALRSENDAVREAGRRLERRVVVSGSTPGRP